MLMKPKFLSLVPKLFQTNNYLLDQQSPTFSGPGTGFTEDYFYTDRAWECFQDDFGTVGFALL